MAHSVLGFDFPQGSTSDMLIWPTVCPAPLKEEPRGKDEVMHKDTDVTASVLTFSGPFFGSFPSFALKLTFDPFSFLTPFSWQWCSVGRNHGQLICEEWCRAGSKKSQVALLGERKNRGRRAGITGKCWTVQLELLSYSEGNDLPVRVEIPESYTYFWNSSKTYSVQFKCM